MSRLRLTEFRTRNVRVFINCKRAVVRKFKDHTLFSASDLMKFTGCKHATVLDMARMRGEGPQPRADSEDAALLQKQGNAHEAAHLEKLKAQGRRVIEIDSGNLVVNAAETRKVLAKGLDVIFQGAFLSGNWGGWSDFLERVARPSTLGNFSYEVADTKLKRTPHPKHVLQLVLYSDLLAEIQGVMPEYAHVELGSGERATLRLKDYSAYARAARGRLETFVAKPEAIAIDRCQDDLGKYVTATGRVLKNGPMDIAEKEVADLAQRKSDLAETAQELFEAISLRREIKKTLAELQDTDVISGREQRLSAATKAHEVALRQVKVSMNISPM